MKPSHLLFAPLAAAATLLAVGCLDAPSEPPPPAAQAPSGAPAPVPTANAGGTVAGLPVAAITPTSIDFGAIPCGAGAPAERTITVRNDGAAPLTYTAKLDDTHVFAIAAGDRGTVAPGAAATLHVRANAIDAAAAAGTAASATLTLTTSDPRTPQLDVPLRAFASGGTLRLEPATIDFGDVSLKAGAQSQPVVLRNVGNAPVSVAFGAPSDPAFSIAWPDAPKAATIAPGATLTGVTARFAPTAAKSATASSALVTTGSVCGASVTTLALRGNGSAANASVHPGALDFGQVACGTTAAAQTLTIANAGNAPMTFAASLGAGSPFAIAPASGSVPAGGTTTITVSPKAVPSVSPTTDDLYADAITITTDAPGDVAHVVHLHETAYGARLAIAPAAIDLGAVKVGASTTSPFTITNAGNAPATVTLGSSAAAFGATPTTASAIAQGGSLAATASFSPSAAGSAAATITARAGANDVLCAPAPTLAVTGNGTEGSLGLSATAVDFGAVACGTTAAAKTVTLRNDGTAALAWSAALAAGASSPYVISPASGSLPPAAQATLTITPRAIPATSSVKQDLFADRITITTDVPGDAAHAIDLHESAYGAILSFSTGSLDLGGVPIGASQTGGFDVVNAGNAPASVTLTASGAGFSVSPGSINAVTTTAAATVAFQSTDASAHTGEVALSAPATPLCAALPAALALRAQGTNGVAQISPASIDFGQVACGTQGKASSVTIHDAGNGDLTWTAKVSGPYDLGKTSGSVVAGGNDAIVVTPRAIPTTSAITPDLYAGSLAVTTTAASGSQTTTIALHMTAYGAILTNNQTAENLGTVTANTPTQIGRFQLANGGNAPASLLFDVSAPFSFPNATGTVAANGGTLLVPVNLVYSQPLAGKVYTYATKIAPNGASPMCGPIPQVTLTGTVK